VFCGGLFSFLTSILALQAFGISYMAMYFPGTLLQLWLVDSSGVRSCLVLSSFVLSLSLLVRWVCS